MNRGFCTRQNLRILALFLSIIGLRIAKADIFVSTFTGSASQVISYSQYTGAQKVTFSGPLQSAEGLVIGPDGNLYVADCVAGTVERFNASTGAHINTFVAPIGPPTCPFGITFGPDGNLYMADNSGYIRSFAGSTGAPILIAKCSNPNGGRVLPSGSDVRPGWKPLRDGLRLARRAQDE